MYYSTNKEINKMLNQIASQGWRVEPTKSGHWKCYSPCGKHIVTSGNATASRRALANLRSQLRKYGAKI